MSPSEGRAAPYIAPRSPLKPGGAGSTLTIGQDIVASAPAPLSTHTWKPQSPEVGLAPTLSTRPTTSGWGNWSVSARGT